MGNGRDLPDDVQRDLVPGLRAHPTTMIFLAFEGDQRVSGGQYEPAEGAVLFRQKTL
jgi:hypothetical protein